MNKRYRSFMLVLYPDDETHVDVMNYVEEFILEYAYILHDKDVNEKGEIKKEHYHVVIKFNEGITISSLSKKLNLDENYITPTKGSYVYGLRYLVHADHKDKYQYEVSDVVGPLKSRLIKSLNGDKTESDYIIEIFNLIDNSDYIELSSFLRYLATQGMWTYYRRNAYTINQLISIHNMEYMKRQN